MLRLTILESTFYLVLERSNPLASPEARLVLRFQELTLWRQRHLLNLSEMSYLDLASLTDALARGGLATRLHCSFIGNLLRL
jgi:hypothetical protein